MLAALTAVGVFLGGVAAVYGAIRTRQTHQQVTPTNGTKLAEMVEAHVARDDERFDQIDHSIGTIREHLGVPPDPAPVPK